MTGNQPLGSMVRLTLEVPGWPGAHPGQFALLRAESSQCFLGRAFSVTDQRGDEIEFVIAPVGRGSIELSSLPPGGSVRVLGPLGVGFDVEALRRGAGRAVIVAGGVGIAPFPLLLSRLAEQAGKPHSESSAESKAERVGRAAGRPTEILVLLGFRDAEQAQGAELIRSAAGKLVGDDVLSQVEVITEAGPKKSAGKVTDLLERHLKPRDRLAVCGPEAMAREVWRICSRMGKDVEAWFSLEANLACGVGSCHGCVVTLADGTYARVCHEGPVFSGREVFGG